MGLHSAINQGIAQAHQQGVVTSASIVACGEAFEDAVDILRACPALGAGVHLTLVEERPVSTARMVPSLVDRAGQMRSSYKHFARDWCMGLIKKQEVEYELEAQVERVLCHGIRPSHLDSHQHVHCLPGIWGLVIKIARKYHVPFVRMPAFDRLWCEGKSLAVPILRTGINLMSFLRRRFGSTEIKFADCMRGTAFSGHMTVLNLLRILDNARSGITEVLVHPGLSNESLRTRYRHWDGFSWDSDLQAVTDPRVIARCFKGDITLTSFARLIKSL
jgi:predicted glycoside hydrolase/deacetylase ChbG (UPF0249 family)